MKSSKIKNEFSKIITNAKIVAAIFFVLLTPSIVIAVKDLDELYGISEDIWFYISVLGFLLYGGFTYFVWKCPKCKEFPGRGWFRQSCEKCGVELS